MILALGIGLTVKLFFRISGLGFLVSRLGFGAAFVAYERVPDIRVKSSCFRGKLLKFEKCTLLYWA